MPTYTMYSMAMFRDSTPNTPKLTHSKTHTPKYLNTHTQKPVYSYTHKPENPYTQTPKTHLFKIHSIYVNYLSYICINTSFGIKFDVLI